MNNERESYASLFYRLDYEGNTMIELALKSVKSSSRIAKCFGGFDSLRDAKLEAERLAS